MKNRPLPVIVVASVFILVGCAGFVYHVKELFIPGETFVTILVLLLEIVAIVCGLLLLNRISWARWLAITWLACHVVISAFNSLSEVIMHAIVLIIISVLLFLPASSAYFKNKVSDK